jgi:putative ABC transport system permease protein
VSLETSMPDWAPHIRARLASLRLSPTREAEIVDELSQHLEDRYRELIVGGASREEATELVLADFRSGNVLAKRMASLRQAHVTAPITLGAPAGHVFNDLWQDMRYAARIFWKQPAFTATAVLTLGLGIGANTAMFSVIYGVLLKPLPFHEPEQLVGVYHRASGINRPVMNQGPATYFTYRDNHRVFEDIGGWDTRQVSVTGHGEPERVEALSVTDRTLPLLRVEPVLGRLFSGEDDAPRSPLRIILRYGYWQRSFGGAKDVIGQLLDIDGTPGEIIGVLPPSFKFLRTDPAVLLPMQLDRAKTFVGSFYFGAVARLKPGVTLAQANADVARMIPLILERFPLPPGFSRDQFEAMRLEPNVRPLSADVTGDTGRVLWILLGTVSIVLLIACANVANLFLVRAEAREQELAVRVALGASRGRVARQFLAETMGLALAGGALGLLFARGGISLLTRMAPIALPRIDDIGIDLVVLLFTVAISVLTGLLFGLIPVLRFGTPSVSALKEGGRSASDAPRRHRARHALVVSEVPLAFLLLIVSGLMIRTFIALQHVEPGFVRPQEVQTFRIEVPEGLIRDAEQVTRLHQQIAERLQHVPGVVSVGLSSSITMDGENANYPVVTEAASVPRQTRSKWIAPGYFEAMGNRVVAGRTITWKDLYQRASVVVVSERYTRDYWQKPADAIGQRIKSGSKDPWREIVGVVGDERDDGVSHPAPAIVYWPMLMREFWDPIFVSRTMAYAVRSTRVGSPGLLRELQQAVWSVNPNLPLATVQTLDEIQADSMAQTSFAMVMLAIAASVALLLGVVGIYSVIAYIATQRTREIGIRMALGAQTGDVRRLFLQHGLGLTLIGIVLGIGGAMLLTRVMSALLFGVGPMDPVTYVAVATALAAVALVATYLPARRATRVDPLVALRAE